MIEKGKWKNEDERKVINELWKAQDYKFRLYYEKMFCIEEFRFEPTKIDLLCKLELLKLMIERLMSEKVYIFKGYTSCARLLVLRLDSRLFLVF